MPRTTANSKSGSARACKTRAEHSSTESATDTAKATRSSTRSTKTSAKACK